MSAIKIKEGEKLIPPQASPWKYKVKYDYIFFMSYIHVAGVYGSYLSFTSAKWSTLMFTYTMYWLAGCGIIAGAHRLWTHKSYKAKLPLQIFLMLCHCLAYQKTLFTWIQGHRLHHKYSDTDADPHNATRGFFFSHIGWLLVQKHPELKKREKLIDMSDVLSNPVLMYQRRHASWLLITVAFIIPTAVPVYFFNELFSIAWHLNAFRYIINLNLTFLVNSVSHKWGYKRYDKSTAATQSLPIILVTMGEGFHNFHHAFPCDYRSAELGTEYVNFMKTIIDFWAWLGLAYDLKVVSDDMVKARVARSGDGSNLWGFGKDHELLNKIDKEI